MGFGLEGMLAPAALLRIDGSLHLTNQVVHAARYLSSVLLDLLAQGARRLVKVLQGNQSIKIGALDGTR